MLDWDGDDTMRWLSTIRGLLALSSLWGLAGSGGPTGAAEAKRSLAPIYPIENAIKIDGNVTDWEWAPSLGIGRFAFPILIAEHGTVARFLARYDAEYLYAAFRVTDASPALHQRLQQDRWQGDQVELLLCTDPKEHAKHASFSRYDYQPQRGQAAQAFAWGHSLCGERGRLPRAAL